MQKFYFDTFDGCVVLDDEGQILPDLASARSQARRLLGTLLHEAPSEDETTRFRANVRDESGRCVLSAVVTLVYEAG